MNRVMIIDDEIWVSEVIKNIICWEDYGFCIEDVCHDGVEAMELIRKKRPQLVLTDIRMPGKTGLQIIQEISMELPDTLCVVISGYNDFEYAKTALTYGAIGYLLKPIDGQELKQIMIKAGGILEAIRRPHAVEAQVYEEYEQTIDRLREQFFKNCFEGSQDRKRTLWELNQELKLNFKAGCYRLVSISAAGKAGPKQLFTDISKQLWGKQIPILCNEIVPFLYRSRIILVLNYREEKSEAVLSGIQSLSADVMQKEGGITFLVGDEFGDIFKIQKAYRNVRDMEYMRLFFGCNRLYLFDASVHYGKDTATLLQPNLEVCIRQVLKGGDEGEALKLIREAFEWLLNRAGRNPAAFAKGVYRIVETFKENMAEISENAQETCREQLENLDFADSVEQIKESFLEVMRVLLKAQANPRQQKEKNVVVKVTEYLENNYMNNIALTDIADMVHLNANYFSEIFRKEKGIAFKEYLTQLRMERAKELLKKSNYRQSEIAAMVGYNDTKHFTKIFRKYVGITAGEYRRLMVGK